MTPAKWTKQFVVSVVFFRRRWQAKLRIPLGFVQSDRAQAMKELQVMGHTLLESAGAQPATFNLQPMHLQSSCDSAAPILSVSIRGRKGVII
jgi:hypothetical protein